MWAGAVGPNIRGRGGAVELPQIGDFIPNLNFVLGDGRASVINGEKPI